MKKYAVVFVLLGMLLCMLLPCVASDRTISVNELLSVSLSGDKSCGRVYAALYRDGRMIAVKSYAPEELSTVSFDAMQYGDQVKVLWWDAPMETAISVSENTDVVYKDYSVDDAARLMVVSEVAEFLNANDEVQDAVLGYNTGEGTDDLCIRLVIPGARITDRNGNAMKLERICEGDVVAYSVNEEKEIVEMKVLITADEVKSGVPGWHISRENKEEQNVEEVFGYVAKRKTAVEGIPYFDLSQYPFDGNTPADNVDRIARIRDYNLQGAVYYVDLSKRFVEYEVDTAFRNVQAGNISLDKDGTTAKDGYGYFMYAKIVDKDIVDAVVYIVDCKGFDLNYYRENGATIAYKNKMTQETNGEDAEVSLTVMETDGTWHSYPIAEKVRVFCDGVLYRAESRADFATHAAVWTQHEIWYDETNKKMRCVLDLLCYKLNANGEIATLIIPKKNEATTGTYGKSFTAVYDAETGMLGDIKITESTVVYAVKNGIENRQDYIKISQKVLKDGETYTGEYLVSVGGDKTVPDAIVVNYQDNSVIDTERFMVVEEMAEFENEEGNAQAAIIGYQFDDEESWIYFIDPTAAIFDCNGNVITRIWDICEGDVVAYTLNEKSNEIVALKVLFTAEEVLSDTPGFSKTYTNEDGQTVKEVYGYVAASSTDETGNTNYQLSQYPFSDDEDIANVEFMDEIISDRLTGSVYYVDFHYREPEFTVHDNFEYVCAGNISLDRDGSTKKNGEGYFMYTKIVDGNMVDAVVYIVDCKDFYLDYYSETGATFAYVYDISQEITGKDAVVSMKVMGKDGTWNTYPISETVRVFCDGVLYRAESRADFATNAAVWTQDEIWYDETNEKMRCVLDLLCYKLNANGEISTLIIPTDNEATTGTYGDSFTAVYDAETGMLGDIKITESTVVYAVKNGKENRQDYIKLSQKVLKDGETYTGEYLVSVGGDKTVPDAIVVNYTDYSVVDTERFMIVSEASEYENEEGDAQDALDVYQNYEEIWTIFVSPTAKITDRKGNTTDSGRFFGLDLYEGDVIAATLNDELEIEGIRVLFTAEEVLRDSDGFHNTYINADGQTVEEIYGYVAAQEYNAAGNPIFKLSAHPFTEDDISPENVPYIAEIDTAQMDDLLYMVDLSRKNVYFDVYEGYDFDLSLIRPANITLDRDGSTTKQGEGYFMYTKIVDGQVIDMVVYIVDCADFDLSKYSTEQVQ